MRLPLWSANIGIALALVAISNTVFRSTVRSVVVASNGQLVSRTTAIVSGGFDCTWQSSTTISAVLTQTIGGSRVQGRGDLAAIRARGSYQAFEVPVAVQRPPGGYFRAGPASLVVDINCGSAFQQVSSRVQLRN